MVIDNMVAKCTVYRHITAVLKVYWIHCCILLLAPVHVCTLKSAYNEKKYAEILLCYRWLFVKGNIFIGEWGIWCEYFPSL